MAFLGLGRKKALREKIRNHMGMDPATLPIVTEQFEKYNHPNLHLALDEYISQHGRTSTIVGIQGGFMNFTGTTLSEIVSPGSVASFIGFGGAKEGPVQYMNVQLNGGQKLACVQGGLYLVSGEPRLVVLLRQQQIDFAGGSDIVLDVMANERSIAENFMNEMRLAINKHNIYRGKLLSIEKKEGSAGGKGSAGIKFHELPAITRDRIVLPDGLLNRIERQTVEVGRYSEALLNARRKLKRGILLHGAPGTGKTLTAMYLASEMQDRTVLILTGRGLGLIESSCEIARWLQPSMVIIEDVDLIAEERSQQQACTMPILFELLNQMDGLADDADVLFLLTTNRPDILEPALAARPGRVDQAYELPLPDLECRKRLFNLYSQGLTMRVNDMDSLIRRTSGASGAFISELLRKAALFAAPESDPIVVEDRHMDEAMHELVIVGGTLTKSLLGFREIGFVALEAAPK